MQEVDLLRKGPWVEEEDEQLAAAVAVLGDRRWDSLAKASGLRRSGKSCRLRWMNYLRPNLKHGNISEEEEKIIVELHEKWGNKWSRIARKLPGRTDNEIKNYWRSHLRKKPLLLEKESLSSATNPSSGSECWTGSPCSTNDDQRFSMRADHISRPPDDAMFETTMSLTRSPYETRLSEWASSNETNFVYPEWSTSDDWNWITSCSTWDLSLWDGQ